MKEESHAYDSEDATTTRRGFFKVAIGIIAGLNGLVLGLPFLKTLMSSSPKRKTEWSRLGDVGSLPQGKPVEMKFEARIEDAYQTGNDLNSVWAVKHAPDRVTVFSPICPHLGCHYLWKPKSSRFECPCHASVFAADGKVLYGPAPRPLDTLPGKIEKGVLFIQWERFKVGTPEKIAV